MSILLGAALATGGAGLVGQGINALSAGRQNRKAREFQREMYARQREDSLSDWHMQNAYNTPSAQMQRLKDGGLNPNLVYGTGAQTEAPTPRGSQASTPSFKPVDMDLGSVALQAMQMSQLKANIAKTNAETESIRTGTISKEFDNRLRETLGISHFYDKETSQATSAFHSSKIKEIESSKAGHDYNAWASANFEGQPSDDPNSPLAKAYRAGIQRTQVELDNARKLGDIRTGEAIIKHFEAELTKQGISPNSPWYVKILSSLIDRVTEYLQ